MRRLLALLVAAAWCAAPALADVVHLKNGGTLEGQVVETPDGVVVKLPAGEVKVSKDAIARIEKKPSVLDEFQKRVAELKADDAAGHFALAQWAEKNHLKEEAQVLCQQVIAIDPNHAGARQALGHRLVNGQWMTEEQEMAARGLVRFEGQWMPPEAAAKLRELRTELEVAREKRLAAEAELKRAQQEMEAARPPEPPTDENPYDRYYEWRDAERQRSRLYYHYYGGYYAPYWHDPLYRPYGGWTYYGYKPYYRPRY